MTRTRLLDAAILLIMLPAWLLCFALCTRDVLCATSYTFAYVETSPDLEYPMVLDDEPAGDARTAFEPGDLIVRWGKIDLRHATFDEFNAAVEDETPHTHLADVVVLRDGRELPVKVSTGSYRTYWPRILAAIVFVSVGFMLYLGDPRNGLIRSFVGMMFSAAFLFVCTFAPRGFSWYLADAAQVVGVSGFSVFLLRSFQRFPHDEPPRRAWLRALPWVFVLTGPLDLERSTGLWLPTDVANFASLSLILGNTLLTCATVIWNYVRASAVHRRMMKWVLWGIAVTTTIVALMTLLSMFAPRFAHAFYISTASLAILPIVILIALRRFNLFDINRVLSMTAAIFTALAIVAIGLLSGLSLFARAASASLELPVWVLQSGLSLFLLLGVVVTYRALAPRLERIFYRERLILQDNLPETLTRLRATRTLREALDVVSDALQHSMNPHSLAIYWEAASAWENVVARGSTIAPALRANSGLLGIVRSRGTIVSLEAGAAKPVFLDDRYDVAFVTALDVAIVIPVYRNEAMVGVAIAGRKRSGDVYVPSEIALLAVLAHGLSERLARFELATLAANAREARDKLRRFVPAAIADAILAGDALQSLEREVTVLFVDIRGYSRYAEGRDASEVFNVINDYTMLISSAVGDHGGQVVEFNGDGMMAVFGALRVLEAKENSAFAASVRIHRELGASRQSRALPGLNVGIGIATGPAFVGSVRAVDRWIWTAIGETTNRSARLQALTRELSAATIIDENTWRALDGVEPQFTAHRDYKLRGLQRRHNLFSLPVDGMTRHPVATTDLVADGLTNP